VLKRFKNDIYGIIEESGIDPKRFKLYEDKEEGSATSILDLIDSPLTFYFINSDTSWIDFNASYIRFLPNYPFYPLERQNSYISFDDCKEIFKSWLKNDVEPYIEDNDRDDRWSEFQFETNIYALTRIEFGNSSNFSSTEMAQVKIAIDNLKTLMIEHFNPTIQELEFINNRLDYLSEATTRLGKFDWSNTFVSILISIAINMCFDTETGKLFFNLIKQVFGSFENFLSN